MAPMHLQIVKKHDKVCRCKAGTAYLQVRCLLHTKPNLHLHVETSHEQTLHAWLLLYPRSLSALLDFSLLEAGLHSAVILRVPHVLLAIFGAAPVVSSTQILPIMRAFYV